MLLSSATGVANLCIPIEDAEGTAGRTLNLAGALTTFGDGCRQVGFLAAPNWSIAGIILWPATFYVLRGLIDRTDDVFRELDGSPMTWLGGVNQRMLRTWRAKKRRLNWIAGAVLAIATIISMIEWYGNSGQFLLGRAALSNASGVEIDWASVSPANAPRPRLQALFTLLAFIYQGVALAIMLTFAATVLTIATTMERHGTGREKPPLIIDIESNDPQNRVGFERFVLLIDYMILFVALVFVNFFLTRIQNAFLHDGNRYDSLGNLVRQDFVVREVSDLPNLLSLDRLDFSSLAVAGGAVIALFICFFFFNATLRHVAIQARNRSDHVLMRADMIERASAIELDRGAIRERLKSANVWPLGYSDLMPTLSFLTICVTVIVFYRIGIYLVFLWILGWVLARAATGLIRGR